MNKNHLKTNQLLETKRLVLSPFCIDDIDKFAKICANTNVMRYIADGKPVSRDVIAKKIPE